jgi:adhesin/invasin
MVTSVAPTITVIPGPVSLANSEVSLSSTSVASANSITVTLQAEDAKGNKETTGGLVVAFRLVGTTGAKGIFSAMKDNKNGTYTATFTGTIAGNNSITATISGYKITSSAPAIQVTPGSFNLAKSLVILTSSSVKSGSGVTVTLQARDSAGNDLASGGQTIAFALGSTKGGQGTFSAVTDKNDGTYTAQFTGTIAGINTIDATIDGSKVTSIAPVVTVTPGPASLATSFVTLSVSTIKVGTATKVTLQAKDAVDNKETTGGLTVLFILESASAGLGTFSTVTDNHNGTYTATFKGTALGSNEILAEIAGKTITTTPADITIT